MCRPFSFAACVRHHRSPNDLFRLRMKTRSRSKLVHLLLSKSMAEALLVTAVAVAFYFSPTNRHLRGVLDRSDSQTVPGWVVDEAQPATRVEVQLFIDEKFAAGGGGGGVRPHPHQARPAGPGSHRAVFCTPSARRAGEATVRRRPL